MIIKRIFLVISCFCCLRLAQADSASPVDEARVEGAIQSYLATESALVRATGATATKALAVQHAYNDKLHGFLSAGRYKEFPDKLVESLLDAANHAAFYSLAQAPTDDMLALSDELESRHRISEKQIKDVFEALLAARRVPEALAWRTNHAEFFPDPVPKFEPAGAQLAKGPTVWKIADGKVSREAFDNSSGVHIIVIAHPHCHFSLDAIAQIFGDKALSARLKGHLTWMLPQIRNYDLDVVRDWNREHADVPMVIAYKSSEWPRIDVWDTPVFYFFKDGQLMSKVVGWPKEGQIKELSAAADKVGI